MPDTKHWAFIGDLQMPYQDNRAVALWFQVMKWWKPEAIDIVGDIDDQLCYSRFSDGTTDEFFNLLKQNGKDNDKAISTYHKESAKEIERETPLEFPPLLHTDPIPYIKEQAKVAADWYADVRKAFKKADIHNSLGNHDIRINDYIDKKAPEYNAFITPENLWGLDNLGITWRGYDDAPMLRFNDIHVHHGATATDTGLAVRGDIEKYNISLVRGHDHRGGVVFKSYPLANKKLVGMGTGHMCNPAGYGLGYTFNPAWELGFGIGHLFGDQTQLEFIPITPDYQCVVDGKLFQG